MKKSMFGVLGILLILGMLLSACQSPAAPEQPAAPQEPAAPLEPEAPAPVTKTKANIVHYYSGELGKKDMNTIIEQFNVQSEKCEVVDNTQDMKILKPKFLSC